MPILYVLTLLVGIIAHYLMRETVYDSTISNFWQILELQGKTNVIVDRPSHCNFLELVVAGYVEETNRTFEECYNSLFGYNGASADAQFIDYLKLKSDDTKAIEENQQRTYPV
jgi:hypothetical protein